MRTHRHRLSVALALSLCLSPVPAAGDLPRALPPEASALVSRAFRSLAPDAALRAASIERDHVVATACRTGTDARTGCVRIVLSDPLASCAGEVAGPWCVSYPDGPLDAAVRARLHTALALDRAESVWIGVDTVGPPPPGPVAPPPPRESSLFVFLLALSTVAVPLAIGLLAGAVIRRTRRRRGEHPLEAAAVPVVLALVVFFLPPSCRLVGFWDALLAALFLAAGYLLVAHRAFEDRRRVALAATAVVLTCLLGECATRIALPAPRSLPAATGARFLLGRARYRAFAFSAGQEAVCNTLFGAGWSTSGEAPPVLPSESLPGPRRARRVLYLGDSMTFGVGVPRERAFPSLLAREDPAALHVNGAVSAIGPDGYLVLLRGWLDRLAPTLVVMNLFAGNDLADLDRPYPCCDGGPLLRYDGSPHLRCERPGTIAARLGLRSYLVVSPPPYALRALSGSSRLAAYATIGLVRLSGSAPPSTPSHDAAAHLERILRAARDETAARGGRFVVVVLPRRASLEHGLPGDAGQHAGEEMVRVARSLSIPVLDAWDVFAEALAARGSQALFVDEIHFSSEGHRLLAEWSRPRLDALQRTLPTP